MDVRLHLIEVIEAYYEFKFKGYRLKFTNFSYKVYKYIMPTIYGKNDCDIIIWIIF